MGILHDRVNGIERPLESYVFTWKAKGLEAAVRDCLMDCSWTCPGCGDVLEPDADCQGCGIESPENFILGGGHF